MKKVDIIPANINKVELSYTSDPDVVLNSNSFTSKEGIGLSIFRGLSSAQDTRINNYSNLTLTDPIQYKSIGHIKTKKTTYPEKFTSYLIANVEAYKEPDDNSKYISIDTTKIGVNMQTVVTNIDLYTNSKDVSANNENYFEFTLLNNHQCTVSYYDNFKTLYLSFDKASDTFEFSTDAYLSSTHNRSSDDKILNYLVDRTHNYICLYKRQDGKTRILHHSATITAVSASKTAKLPQPGTFFKIRLPARQSAKIQLSNDWVSYKPGSIDGSDLSINPDKSHTDLSNNILLNCEYEKISGSKIPLNFTPLKNQLTSEHNQSRNNPFPLRTDVDFREYSKIFSGHNQLEGNDKISLGFDNYTRKLKFKQDTLTYFHMPIDMYPYDKININDAGLVEAGAIGSDTPLRADKIFKKLSNYKTSSNFGDSSCEETGTYLCSWLMNHKGLDTYRWVDRYFNTKKLSQFEALATSSPVTYTTYFEDVDAQINTGNNAVYDKLSDLTLEPGSLYAYHRIGKQDIANTVGSIPNRLHTGLNEFQDAYGNSLSATADTKGHDIYKFNGSARGKTTPAKDIKNSNNLTVSFHMYSDDWSKPFGHQIFGNYITDGFGVFNKQAITPFITLTDTTNTYIFNSNFKLLNTIPLTASNILRGGPLEDIHIVNGDNIITYDLRGNKIKEIDMREGEDTVYTLEPSDTFMYNNSAIVMQDGSTSRCRQIDLSTSRYQNHANHTGLTELPSTDISERPMSPSYDISEISTSLQFESNDTENMQSYAPVISNGVVYTGWGTQKDVDIYDNIWKLQTRYNKPTTDEFPADYIIKRPNGSNSTAFYGLAANENEPINCFKTDIRGDVWVLHNANTVRVEGTPCMTTLSKYTNDRNLIFSKVLSGSHVDLATNPLSGHKAMDFIREFDGEGFKEYCIILDQQFETGIPPNISNEIVKAETTCYYFNMSGNYVKQVTLPINLTKSIESMPVNLHVAGAKDLSNSDSKVYARGITNYDHVKREYANEDASNKLTFKCRHVNPLVPTDSHTETTDVDVSNLKPGWHSFIYSTNSESSTYTLYVDGELYKQTRLSIADRYALSDIVTRSFTVGSSPFFGSVYLQDVLNQPGYYGGYNFNLKLVNVFNDNLNYFDLLYLYRQGKEIQDLEWIIPGGRRGYIETIERFYKHRLPGHKTNFYETVIHAPSALSATGLVAGYENNLNTALKDYAPINNKQIKSTWLQGPPTGNTNSQSTPSPGLVVHDTCTPVRPAGPGILLTFIYTNFMSRIIVIINNEVKIDTATTGANQHASLLVDVGSTIIIKTAGLTVASNLLSYLKKFDISTIEGTGLTSNATGLELWNDTIYNKTRAGKYTVTAAEDMQVQIEFENSAFEAIGTGPYDPRPEDMNWSHG
jgi:hypothetical protein